MLSRAHWEKESERERDRWRERERDAVKIKGIGYHRFNDFTVRMNDGWVWRYEGKIKESDGVKTLSDMLAASSSHSAIQSSSHSHFGGLHLDRWMDRAYHITVVVVVGGNQRHVPSCEKPHLSNSLTHFTSLLAPTRGSRKTQNILNGCCEASAYTVFLRQRLKICREAERDWHNFKESLIRLSKKKKKKKAQSVLFTPVNMGILWQVQSLDKHGFLPAVEIKVVCLEVDGRDWLGGSFPHRQGNVAAKVRGPPHHSPKNILRIWCPSQSGYTICALPLTWACQN